MSLANQYRPQKFSEVVGQQLATTALSRAAAEDRVAPAYLLSGTRGVGKTTIARIFAKALNCRNAPAAEPCNNCDQCRHVTAGNHVDVNEIDGASNTGVDDVRALRENIGYMPMEGRYKIFIVDEAHMLSKSAFNALLKTLEEPPPRTVFIFATTEAQRFPPTIISRCQHFVFRHLPEDAIFSHLASVLEREKIEYEETGVHLLAKRAAGSVRDSMSLLDQVLALSGGALTEATVRESLGLAGQELFNELFAALSAKDCAGIVKIAGHLLDSGVDIGFFLRELGAVLRNLFLIGHAGASIVPVLGVTADEKAFLERHTGSFSPSHVHAAWQMTLESQRGITMSPEPGAALELLLLNLAMLPQLLPVGMASQPIATSSGDNRNRLTPSALQNSTPTFSGKQQKQDTAAAPSTATRWKMGEAAATPCTSSPVSEDFKWNDFCAYCQKNPDNLDLPPIAELRQITAALNGAKLTITFSSHSVWNRVMKKCAQLEAALKSFLNRAISIECIEPTPGRSDSEIRDECEKTPEFQLCKEILDANLIRFKEKPIPPKEI